MRNHVTAHDLAVAGMAAAMLLCLSWLFGGRRVKAPPASSALPQTFIASRLIPAIGSIFAICGVVVALALATAILSMPAKEIGPLWFRLFVSTFTLLFGLFSAYGVKLFVVWTIWPDRLSLTEEGIFARLQRRECHWAWNKIADVRVRLQGTKYETLELILKDPDPEQVRRLARFPWTKKRDPRIIWLEDLWKPTALLTSGDMAVRDSIRAVLEKRRQLPAK